MTIATDESALRSYQLGLSLLKKGRAVEALPALESAARLAPERADFAKDAGNAWRQQDRLTEAEAWYRRALEADPKYIPALNNLALILRGRKAYADAERLLRLALEQDAQDADLWTNLGVTVQEDERLDEATGYYRKALSINGNDALAWNNLAAALNDLKAPLSEIAPCCHEAARLLPGQGMPFYLFGRACLARRQFVKAVEPLENARQLMAGDPDVEYELGIAYTESGNFEPALECFQRVQQINPGDENARYQEALVLHLMKRHEEAIPLFDALLENRKEGWLELPQSVWARLRGAHWKQLADREALLEASWEGYAFNPYTSLIVPVTPMQQKTIAERFYDHRYSGYRPLDPPFAPLSRSSVPPRKIRIGYFSCDFGEHPVAYLTAELFERHDRYQFEVFGIAYGQNDQSLMRRRIENACDQFVDLAEIDGLDAYQAARRIRELEIDVLIDLTGYTSGGWQEVLSLRAAPLQISYIGYLGSSGAPFMDYMVTDSWMSPPGSDSAYTEKLIRLPWYQANDRLRRPATDMTRSMLSLPEDAVVFANLGQTYKIRPEVFDRWASILGKVKNSVLWIQGGNAHVDANLKREIAERGIHPDRLIFARKLDQASYLGALKMADIFLDTSPYNAGATGSDALWMDVPLVTCPGDTFSSRYGASLLAACDLPQLIAASWDDYEAIAVDLAIDTEKRRQIRSLLARRDSRLFDSSAFTTYWEQALTSAWKHYLSGSPPLPITIS